MNAHLTSTQISEWMIGDRSPEARRHLERCPECSAEVSKIEGSLGLFRDAMQEAPVTAAVWKVPARRSPWAFPLRSIAVTFAVLLLAIIPVYGPVYRDRQVKAREAEARKQDALLLSQVESELNESIPEPMQPLAKLVSYQNPQQGTK